MHEFLGARVDAAGCLVEDEHWRIGNGSAGDGQQLALTLAQVAAISIEDCLVAIAQTADEAVGIDQFGGLDAVLVSSIQAPITDVVHHRSREQMGLLQHHAEAVAQVTLADLVDADAVIGDLAVLDIIEAVDEVGDGSLACTRPADESNLHVRHRINVDVKEYLFLLVISKVYLVQFDTAVHLAVDITAVGLRNLPGPYTCAAIGGVEFAVATVSGIDERDFAVVGLGLLIIDLKDAVGAYRGVEHAVDLLADAGNGTGKTLVQRQESHQRTQRHPAVSVKNQSGAEHTHEHVTQVSQVAVDRHHDVADAVGIVGIAAQLLVDDLELFDGFVLVAEYLNDLLAGHHLLDKAVHLGKFLLLNAEMLAGTLAQIGGGPGHDERHDNRQDGHRHTHDNHAGKGDGQRDKGVESLGQAVADHLPQRVDVVGVDRHHVAVGMGVEILDGQGFHVVERARAQLEHCSLTDVDHQAAMQIGAQGAENQHDAQFDERLGQRCVVGVQLAHQRLDVVVDEGAGE